MNLLGIETSCDETSVAIVKDGRQVLSIVISSSSDLFAKSGGVIPEEAARKQVECLLPVLHACFKESGLGWNDIDAIAVTKGPGLLGSLLVGTIAARTLASIRQKPLIGVHHTLGHLSSTWLVPNGEKGETISFPILTLSASGGHTDLWLRESHTKSILLGKTRDDAAGEAFDKGASLLGLPYPGGPSISKSAEDGDETTFEFPLPLRDDPSLSFSFSGLKTSLKYTLRDLLESGKKLPDFLPDLAASYQFAICNHLADRVERALEKHPEVHEIQMVGGVSANQRLRLLLQEKAGSILVRAPRKIVYCTDNAAMIASAAYFLVQERGDDAYKPWQTESSLPLHADAM